MKLYQTKDHLSLIAGSAPAITIPQEIVGLDTPKTFMVNIAFMLASQNDPCFTAMTAFGIRYVGWKLAQDKPDRSKERMLYIDAPSGAAVHMSIVMGDNTKTDKLVKDGLLSLPQIYQVMLGGRLEVELSPLPRGQVIGFV